MAESKPTYTNFTLDIDGDGIALVTWNAPGRTMNVIDVKVIEELSAIVEELATDGAVKGVVITSGKDTFCAGADLDDAGSFEPHLRRSGGVAGRGSGECEAVRREPQAVATVPPHRDLRQAVGRGDQRHRGRRRFRADARLPSSHRRRQRANPARSARDQDRSVPGRRRHAAHRAHAGARPTRCNSCSRAISCSSIAPRR